MRVVIVHIPKTGGTSLLKAFEQVCSSRSPFIMGHPRPEPESLEHYDLIAGHFGYNYAKRLGGHMVTVLREPVSRVLSHYNFWRTFPPGTKQRGVVDGRSLKEYLTSGHPSVPACIVNAQSWQIAHDSPISARRGVPEDELLDLAKARLCEYAAVGTTEGMADFESRVRGLGIPIPDVGVRNVTRRQKAEVDRETLELIEGMVQVDLALYASLRPEAKSTASALHRGAAPQGLGP